MKNIVTTDCTISHSSGSKTSGGTFTVTTPPSISTKIDGSAIYRGTITISFIGGNSSETLGGTGTIAPATVLGTITISGSAINTKDDNQAVLLEGDSNSFVTLFGTFIPNAFPSTPVPNTPIPVTSVEISSAGQVIVKGE